MNALPLRRMFRCSAPTGTPLSEVLATAPPEVVRYSKIRLPESVCTSATKGSLASVAERYMTPASGVPLAPSASVMPVTSA